MFVEPLSSGDLDSCSWEEDYKKLATRVFLSEYSSEKEFVDKSYYEMDSKPIGVYPGIPTLSLYDWDYVLKRCMQMDEDRVNEGNPPHFTAAEVLRRKTMARLDTSKLSEMRRIQLLTNTKYIYPNACPKSTLEILERRNYTKAINQYRLSKVVQRMKARQEECKLDGYSEIDTACYMHVNDLEVDVRDFVELMDNMTTLPGYADQVFMVNNLGLLPKWMPKYFQEGLAYLVTEGLAGVSSTIEIPEQGSVGGKYKTVEGEIRDLTYNNFISDLYAEQVDVRSFTIYYSYRA